ncbi:G-type lectin S-receptor-like serine/threonine-protein kinase [Dichanthelium oligosanthes]|uniref:Receptor-like serine/threonine-protein kinase n=1 Tax=Dichanthelium oligosanthes TaxID=888268 RepID=A0A1E5VSM3_9POAL|nr:G-type lectin S-receptor-like serine/threonine-protein kinase [Dichanthelium oligosanthes]
MSATAFLPTLVGLLALLAACRSTAAAATDTISPGRVLSGVDGRLLSNNSKFTLGFFRAPDGNADPSPGAAPPPNKWYLGIWFTAVPNHTTVWVANGANQVMDGDASPELAVSGDGDLVVVNKATRSVTWSARSTHDTAKNTTAATNATVAVLLNSGNLVLLDASNSSSPRTLWQSFDHPTDTLLPSAKLGRDKSTGGLNRRLVSRKSSATPSHGPYCFEVDPDAPQLVLKLCGSPVTYWTTGPWNGKYFGNIPEMAGNVPNFHLAFVDDADAEYLQFNVTTEATVTRNIVDVTGQNKHQVWIDASRDWLTLYAAPKEQCDVYAACGAFTVCSYTALQPCSCMKGFSVRSQRDWEQGDRTGGCVRDAPLDCNSSTRSAAASSTDGFFSMPGIGLPDRGQSLQNVRSSAECSTTCLKNCSCTAYSYGSQGCLVWQDGLINAKQPQSNGTSALSNGEILYLRLAAIEFQTSGSNKKRGVIIGVVAGACTAALVLLVLFIILMIRRKKAKNNIQVGGGLVAFSFRELRSATKNFSEKLGQGGFGSVFKGQLRDSTAIAVKRLDGSFQGEKQFRAEVSSIGIIQHINLVKLVGFCCEGENRFLVYEHVPNRSLDIHLFQSTGAGGVFLDWGARYQIAVGVARGLSYLHDACRDRIIHCDVKPQNILLDASLLPKIADFGMAKFVGRGFSRVLTTMRGTKGYLAPEWISGTAVTPKVDVYSYGMVLLELVSGRRNSDGAGEECGYTASDGGGDHAVYFPMKAARELIGGDVRKLLDERLRGDANLKEVERACKVACWCIQDDEADRPTMGEVVQILEGVLDRDMPPLPRLLETIFARPPHSSTQQTTTASNTPATFTSGSGSTRN